MFLTLYKLFEDVIAFRISLTVIQPLAKFFEFCMPKSTFKLLSFTIEQRFESHWIAIDLSFQTIFAPCCSGVFEKLNNLRARPSYN